MGGVRGVRGASVGALVLVWGGYNGRLHELPLLKLEVPLFKSGSPAMEVEGRATRMRVVYADHEARSADSRSLVHARDERDEYYGGDSVTKVRGAARPADRYRKLANIREDGAEK